MSHAGARWILRRFAAAGRLFAALGSRRASRSDSVSPFGFSYLLVGSALGPTDAATSHDIVPYGRHNADNNFLAFL